MLLGWLAQGASGIGFALTSYTMKGALPEVTDIALGALVLKVGCTFIGTVLTGFYLATGYAGPLHASTGCGSLCC